MEKKLLLIPITAPDELRYLWVQLDQNMRAKNSTTKKLSEAGFSERGNKAQTAFNQLKNNQFYMIF